MRWLILFIFVVNTLSVAQVQLGGGVAVGSNDLPGGGTRFSGVCDGSTDDTATLNTQLAAILSTGGGTLVFVPGKTCLFSSAEITIPNNSDTWTDGAGTISSQNPLRWTCGGPIQYYLLMSSGATVSQVKNACTLNFTFNAPDFKIITTGMGRWEIDHLAFIDSGSDCSPFILTTNTNLNFHDNAVIGGSGACQDALTMGGTDLTQGKVITSPFQGYGSTIHDNFFNRVKRAVLGQVYFNGVPIQNNTIWSGSAYTTGGAIEVFCGGSCAGAGSLGNLVEGNVIETTGYKYGIHLLSGAQNNYIIGNSCYDNGGSFVGCIGIDAGAGDNLILSTNKLKPSVVEGASDTIIDSTDSSSNIFERKILLPQFPFSQLPGASSNGTIVFCTDCKNLTDDGATFDSTATGSGHGTNVLRENSAWRVH